jgi:transposase
MSDEDVVQRWIENPYWQHFSGERYFRHELPRDPSSLVRWRQRIGKEGCEWLLEHCIKAAMSAGVVAQCEQVTEWLPRQGGDVSLSNLQVLNAILGVAEHGCKLARPAQWTRQLALDLGYTPVAPPLSMRPEPGENDREMYKRRNEFERLFRRRKGNRRIFSRFEKLDVMFLAFICFDRPAVRCRTSGCISDMARQ